MQTTIITKRALPDHFLLRSGAHEDFERGACLLEIAGASVWGGPHKTLARARKAAIECAQHNKGWQFEVERVLELPGGGRRYWLMRRGRWVLWSANLGSPADRSAWCAGFEEAS